MKDLADQASELIEGLGVSAVEAYLLGARIADGFAARWAGHQVYIPSGTWNGRSVSCFKRAERDLEIYRAYTGRNADELAVHYGISPRRVRQVYTSLRARFRHPL